MIKPDEDVQTIIEELKASEKTHAAKHCVNDNHADEKQRPMSSPPYHQRTGTRLRLISYLTIQHYDN